MQIPGLGEVEKDDDLGWYFGPPMAIPVLGGDEYRVVVDGYDGDSRPEDFHAAIANFLSLRAGVLKQAAPFVFAYYRDCVAAAGLPATIASPADVWGQIRFGDEPQVTRRAYGDKGVYVSVACECDWEAEHGLQIVFKNGLVVNKVGAFDGHVTNSDAYGDPRLEDVVYLDRETLQRRIAARKKQPAGSKKTTTPKKTTSSSKAKKPTAKKPKAKKPAAKKPTAKKPKAKKPTAKKPAAKRPKAKKPAAKKPAAKKR